MTRAHAMMRVSVHGGHSGEFCCHAEDSLEDIVRTYISRRFAWFGVTEHMPPTDDRFLYEDEISSGYDAAGLHERFERYMTTARQLQRKYASAISMFVAFETEAYSGALDLAQQLRSRFRPDYVLGSVHHVNDLPIDATPEAYNESARISGGMDAFYCDYFDLQYEMILSLKPEVVGHFDLVRIFDADYTKRLEQPDIRARIQRNLEAIKHNDIILDFNVRALAKGMAEPYVASSVLQRAKRMGISVVPGDDSHGVKSVGLNLDTGMALLRDAGFDTRWRLPTRRSSREIAGGE